MAWKECTVTEAACYSLRGYGLLTVESPLIGHPQGTSLVAAT